MPLCARLNLHILQGDKVVEIKSPRFTKGSETLRLLRQERYDFILALGDDTTDDDMFAALPPEPSRSRSATLRSMPATICPNRARSFLCWNSSPGTAAVSTRPA